MQDQHRHAAHMRSMGLLCPLEWPSAPSALYLGAKPGLHRSLSPASPSCILRIFDCRTVISPAFLRTDPPGDRVFIRVVPLDTSSSRNGSIDSPRICGAGPQHHPSRPTPSPLGCITTRGRVDPYVGVALERGLSIQKPCYFWEISITYGTGHTDRS